VGCEFLIIRAKFASTYTFTLVKWVFFDLFLLLQNLKVAIYKGFRVSGRSKKAKKSTTKECFTVCHKKKVPNISGLQLMLLKYISIYLSSKLIMKYQLISLISSLKNIQIKI